MFLTNEELDLVVKWNHSHTLNIGKGDIEVFDKFLMSKMPINPKLVFLFSGVRDYGNNVLIKDYCKAIHVAFAVTEEGFESFKIIYNSIKQSVLFTNELSVHFIPKMAVTKDGSVEPFVFTSAVIGFKIEAKTEEHFKFQTEQYVTILSRAFQKGYEHAIA